MRLFITYAREDQDVARRLDELMEAGGHASWFDQQLLPGQDWKAELEREIVACDAYVYLLSVSSLSSEWCQWEFATAVQHRKTVIPVLLQDGLTLPEALNRLQYANLTDGITPASIAQLMGALTLVQRVAPADSPTPPVHPQGTPARALTGAAHWTDAVVGNPHEAQDEAEKVVEKFTASLLRGIEPVAGRIVVTNQRLLFEPHGANLQREPLAIPLREIREARKLLFVPTGLVVRRTSGEEYRFFSYSRGQLLTLIDKNRADGSR